MISWLNVLHPPSHKASEDYFYFNKVKIKKSAFRRPVPLIAKQLFGVDRPINIAELQLYLPRGDLLSFAL
ncbi:MAG: hypothetical protein A3B91_04850 [Candidatus Yanofskybacteria bacterium RIFCSPHIGHO2_02_FULL_41_29]|nr:MAG: hypothetical protein A3B91_04850 [Candidatus Yanofskybacteria bacterium RIFCSPHIGHO2_02_FULL_41_29]OGN24835.1 MAG: hypothetical protein A2916_04430 [Candidatus Yanofskybacteria bacterium RIFCSPLOWO2_01_FULL_41_67]